MSFIPSSLSLTDITSDFSKSIIKSRTRRLTLYDQTRPITNTGASVNKFYCVRLDKQCIIPHSINNNMA